MPAPWGRISAILDEALELSGADRRAYLDRACGDDSALRAEVEALLRFGEGSAGFLDEPVADHAAVVASLESAGTSELVTDGPGVGSRIGPYRLVREAGRGGMGAVFEAERADEQFRQRVALKIVRRGLHADSIFVRRFLDERQILADLEHPNIARLLDGGVTGDGDPWFAMEFVEGMPIDRYCTTRGLSIEARLDLFCTVCDAVQYAHRRLIVHRDLKPSNILVTEDGSVKLLDFGIAHLLGADSSTGDDVEAETRMLTPQYASPEQVRGDTLTTASDVYSLGAILYEMLSGRRPYEVARGTVTGIARQLGAEEVLPPSSGTDARVRRRLAGDLDAIVLRAMQKDPERRYPTADGLAADIRRHRSRHPVSARGDSPGYRARLFVRRNRVGVAAGVLVGLALLGGMAGTAWQARAASLEAAKAREVTNFVTGLFNVSNPNESRGREITARELLETGARHVDSALVGQPELHVELLGVLGSIHRALGLYARADTILQHAVDRARATYGAQHPEFARRLTALGAVKRLEGDFKSADSILQSALVIQERRLERNHPDISATLVALGRTAVDLRTMPRAESLYRKALAIDRALYGDDKLEVAITLHELGTALWLGAKLEGADSANRAGLAIRQRHLDPDHPLVTLSLAYVADVRAAQGDLKEAERLQRDVLARRRRLYPNGHPDLAISLHALAWTLEQSGRYLEADALYTEGLETRRKLLGPDHPETILEINNLAVVRYRMGQFAGAEAAFRDVIERWGKTLGPQHLSTNTVVNNLGAALSEQGRYAEAEPLVRQSLALRRARLGDSHVDVAASLRNLGILLHRSGRGLNEAERSLRESLRIYRKELPAGHPRAAEALTALGGLLVSQGDAAEAEPLLREALSIRVEKLADGDWRIAETQRALGTCLDKLGKDTEAEQLLAEAHRRFAASGRSERETEEAARLLAAFRESHRPKGR